MAYVDGFDDETNTVYQFHGCFYRGCITCYDPCVYNVLNIQFGKRHHKTCQTDQLCNLGFNVVEQWECDFVKKINLLRQAMDEQKKKFFSLILIRTQTSPAVLQKKCNENEKFFMMILHLFTLICHPNIFVGDECKSIELENVFGLIKCKVLAPLGLLFPVLTSQINGKLFFTLYKECAETCSFGV